MYHRSYSLWSPLLVETKEKMVDEHSCGIGRPTSAEQGPRVVSKRSISSRTTIYCVADAEVFAVNARRWRCIISGLLRSENGRLRRGVLERKHEYASPIVSSRGIGKHFGVSIDR